MYSKKVFLVCMLGFMLPCLSGCMLNEMCASDEYSEGDKCVPCKLEDHVHINGDRTACEPDTDKVCGNGHENCEEKSKKSHAGFSCEDGKCRATKCHDGYHRLDEDNQSNDIQCEEDTDSNCGSEHDNCEEKSENAHGVLKCINSRCTFESCIKGYHRIEKEDGDSCEEDTIEQCGKMITNCTLLDPNAEFACEEGECKKKKCKDDFFEYNGQCVDDIDRSCGEGEQIEDCTRHEDLFNGRRHCVENQCVVYSCSKDYHLTGEGVGASCVQDTLGECGNPTVSCLVGHGTGECQNGACVFVSCDEGYHQTGNQCEEDNVHACGPGSVDCAPSNPSFVPCERLENRSDCEPGNDGEETCENATTKDSCAETEHGIIGCVDAKCQIDVCVNDDNQVYHVSQDLLTCREDTDTECGESYANCKSEDTSQTLHICNSNSECIALCGDGVEETVFLDNTKKCLTCKTYEQTSYTVATSQDGNLEKFESDECIASSLSINFDKEYKAADLSFSAFRATGFTFTGATTAFKMSFPDLKDLGSLSFSKVVLSGLEAPNLLKLGTLSLSYISTDGNFPETTFPELLEMSKLTISGNEPHIIAPKLAKLEEIRVSVTAQPKLDFESLKSVDNVYANSASKATIPKIEKAKVIEVSEGSEMTLPDITEVETRISASNGGVIKLLNAKKAKSVTAGYGGKVEAYSLTEAETLTTGYSGTITAPELLSAKSISMNFGGSVETGRLSSLSDSISLYSASPSQISYPALEGGFKTLTVNSSSSTLISFPKVSSIDKITVSASKKLNRFYFPQLTVVKDELSITSIGDYTRVLENESSNTSCIIKTYKVSETNPNQNASLEMSKLETVGSLNITDIISLHSMDFSSLKDVTAGNLEIIGGAQYVKTEYSKNGSNTCSRTDLKDTYRNEHVSEILMNKLEKVNGYVSIRYFGDQLKKIQMNKLNEVKGNLNLAYLTGLEKVEFPELTSVDGNLTIGYSKDVKSVSFPKLKTVKGSISFSVMSSISSVSIPNLESAESFGVSCSLYGGSCPGLDVSKINVKGFTCEVKGLPSYLHCTKK